MLSFNLTVVPGTILNSSILGLLGLGPVTKGIHYYLAPKTYDIVL